MVAQIYLNEYADALRAGVCSHCIERLPNGPPCGPLGKGCGIELHLAELVTMCHNTDSRLIDPYIELLHEAICPTCALRHSDDCPCPLDYLLQLAIEAIESTEALRVY
jgi:hypothetical protein